MAERWPVQVLVMMRAEDNTPVQTRWRYTPTDPWAVSVRFGCGCGACPEPVSWTFARALLAAGLRGLSGLGEVQVLRRLVRVDGEVS